MAAAADPLTTKLRVIFFGTAPLAAASLESLLAAPFVELLAVVTQPDKPQGRDLKLTPSPVKIVAERAGLPVLQPIKARAPEFLEELQAFSPDLIVVAAYGQILPAAILDLPKFGCLNVHASLLPKYRGAAPIQWAIANGDPVTGVTIMKMDVGLDTGDMLTKVETTITAQDTGSTVHDRLAHLGAKLLIETLPPYVRSEIKPEPQDNAQSTHARKITKQDGFLDWSKPARQLFNELRAFTPWPGAFTFEPGSKARLKVHAAAIAASASGEPGEVIAASGNDLIIQCGRNALRLLEVQREGGKRMTAHEYLLGKKFSAGERFPLPGTPQT